MRRSFVPGASLCTDGVEPVSTLKDDLRYVGISLYVIENGRLTPQTLLDSSRRFYSRHTSVAFDRSSQGRTFTTYERSGTAIDM